MNHALSTSISPILDRRQRALARIAAREASFTREIIVHPEHEHGADVLCHEGWPTPELEALTFLHVASDPLGHLTLVTRAHFQDGFLFVEQELQPGPAYLNTLLNSTAITHLDLNTRSTPAPVVTRDAIHALDARLGVTRDGLASTSASAHLTLACHGDDEHPAGTHREERIEAAFTVARLEVLTLVAAADRRWIGQGVDNA